MILCGVEEGKSKPSVKWRFQHSPWKFKSRELHDKCQYPCQYWGRVGGNSRTRIKLRCSCEIRHGARKEKHYARPPVYVTDLLNGLLALNSGKLQWFTELKVWPTRYLSNNVSGRLVSDHKRINHLKTTLVIFIRAGLNYASKVGILQQEETMWYLTHPNLT